MAYSHVLSRGVAGHTCGWYLRHKLCDMPSLASTSARAPGRQSLQCRSSDQVSPQWYQPPGRRFPSSEEGNEDNTGADASDFKEYTGEQYTVKEAAKERIRAVLAEVEAQAKGEQATERPQGSAVDPGLQKQLATAITALQQGLVERDTEVRLLLLAALAGEHILFIGPPGTAKSELGRRLASLVTGRFFERLLTRFSVPEELFGPLSMKALEDDQYLRKTEGYLPAADIAFIDEIFKANSAILNSLLTLLNERLFDNGTTRFQVPMTCMVAASNELPESEELDALYDRFLLRRQVAQVSAGSLADMLQSAALPSSSSGSLAAPAAAASTVQDISLPRDTFQSVRAEALQRVKVPMDVIDMLADLRTFLQEKCEPPVYVSDRRLVKALNLLQVAAYTSGQSAVTQFDCLLLQHVLWQRPDEQNRIADWLLQQLAANDGLQQADYLLTGMYARTCMASTTGQTGPDAPADNGQGEIKELRRALANKLSQVKAVLSGRGASAMSHTNMWLGADETEAAVTALEPKMERTATQLERLLAEITTLEVAVDQNAGAFTLATLLPERWSNFLRKGPKEDVANFSVTQGKRNRIPFATE